MKFQHWHKKESQNGSRCLQPGSARLTFKEQEVMTERLQQE